MTNRRQELGEEATGIGAPRTQRSTTDVNNRRGSMGRQTGALQGTSQGPPVALGVRRKHTSFDAEHNARNNALAITHDITQVNKGKLDARSGTYVELSSTPSSGATRRLPEGKTVSPVNPASMPEDMETHRMAKKTMPTIAKQADKSGEAAYHA